MRYCVEIIARGDFESELNRHISTYSIEEELNYYGFEYEIKTYERDD